ncbi:hypothetical protein PV325_011872, partial [Microctonus aethiopoides]
FNETLIKLFVGYHSRNGTSRSGGDVYSVKNIIIHSQYSRLKFDHDIALIKIDGRFNFDNGIRPVCLPERRSRFTGKNGIVTGWGAPSTNGTDSNVLLSVTVPILSNAQCRATKYPTKRITENMMCAGFIEGGKDSCQSFKVEINFNSANVSRYDEHCKIVSNPLDFSRKNARNTCFKFLIL